MFGMGYFLGLGPTSVAVPGGLTVQEVLGSTLKFYLSNALTVDTWTDDIAARNATQATGSKQPELTRTPALNDAAKFNGAQIFETAAGASSAPGHTLIFGCLKIAYPVASYGVIIASTQPWSIYIDTSGYFFADGFDSANTNGTVDITDNKWHRFIAVYKDSDWTIRLYFDGELLPTFTAGTAGTLNTSPAIDIGAYDDTLIYPYAGLLASIGIAQNSAAFSAQNITDLDTALSNFIGDLGNPALLPLTGWYRSDYISGDWHNDWSAGTSGNKSPIYEDPGIRATQGVAVNGWYPADFNGAQYMRNVDIFSDYVTASAGSIAALFNADTADAADNVDHFSNPSIFTSSLDGVQLGFDSSGVHAAINDGANKGVAAACGTGGWHLGRVKWDGANLYVAIDSGGWTSVAAGNIATSLAGTPKVGADSAYASFFDGRIMEIMVADTALSDADFDSIRTYCNTRYNLSL